MNEQSETRRRSLLSLYGMWGGQDQEEAAFRDLLSLLWRRRWVVVATVAVVTLATLVGLGMVTPKYMSTALILVEPRVNRVADSTSVLSGLPADFETIQTELEVITSHGLLRKVVRELSLTKDPEFNGNLKPAWFGRRLLDNLFADDTPPPTIEDVERGATSTLAGATTAASSGRSRVMSLTVEAESPEKAARLANAVADAYLVSQLDAKFEATQRTTTWLNKRLDELKDQVRTAEQAVEVYRQEAGLIEGKGAALASAEQMASLSNQIVLAGTQRAEAEARLSNVQSLINSGDGTGSVSEVLGNDLIQRLQGEEGTLRRNMAALSQRYGPKHPQILQAQVELADIQQKLKGEVAKIVASLQGEVAIARSRENSLLGAQRRLEANMSSENQRGIKLRELSREADASRALLETFLGRFKELSDQANLQTTDARVISRAQPPSGPSSPKTMFVLVLSILASTGLGFAIAMVVERLDSGVHTGRDIERWTGLPVLTTVPELKGKANAATSKPMQIVTAPMSRYTESYRNLLVGLNLSNVDNPPKIIAVTSSNPSEGKTVSSVSLAATAAAAGKRVLIMDCDLRRPRLHQELGVERGPGLVEYLAGQVELEAVMRTDERFNFQYITAGSETQNVLNLIESQKLRALLTQMKPQFGLIVIDTPPLLAVADAKVIADRCDSVVFVVRWGKTSRNTLIDGLKHLEGNAAPVAGVVMTRADMDRLSSYQYGTAYYGKAYKSYYTS
ncbi:polysaccharide biosynthesis tyrosine autokinase [Emcibacter sp. SYSU 3D8]|uniref:GumC family protein n=1 Tax=Emcibacter sp. SYSU 3D8 TaxID=3133969 RepID=UPI0031FE9DD1